VNFSTNDENKRQMVSQGEQTREIQVDCRSTQTRISATAETQTEQDSERKLDPETISGFDDWSDMPPGVARFLERVGGEMEDELAKSDAS
ncbi:unnamed protein product, partial [Ectocarpus sp. 12 AP-2014]